MPSAKRKILVTGSSGQIGSELVPALRDRFGTENVVACDIKPLKGPSGPFELADVTDRHALPRLVAPSTPTNWQKSSKQFCARLACPLSVCTTWGYWCRLI